MSAATTKVLATAAGTPLCDCVVIGFTPDGDIHVDWTGTTLASLFLWLKLAEREAMLAWDSGVDLHKRNAA
jgi:hypothetical protein